MVKITRHIVQWSLDLEHKTPVTEPGRYLHKTLFGFRAPLFWPFHRKLACIFGENIEIFGYFCMK